jgi:hypothetical protein
MHVLSRVPYERARMEGEFFLVRPVKGLDNSFTTPMKDP